MEGGRDARTLVAFAVLACVLAAGAVVPLSPDFDVTFGAEAWRRPGILACAGAALVAAALLLDARLAERAGDAIARIGAAVPRTLRVPIVLAAALAAFVAVPDVSLSGDAMDSVARAQQGGIQPSNSLTSWLHLLGVRLGLDAVAAVRATSIAAGVAGTACAILLGRALFDDGPRRVAATVLVCTTGAAGLWFGSVEVYAAPGAAIVGFLAASVAALRGRAPAWLACGVLGVAFGLHGLAGALVPAAAFVAWGGGGPGAPRRVAACAAAFAVPVAIAFAALWVFEWRGAVPSGRAERWGNFLGASGDGPLVPLLPDPGLRARYAFLDGEHLLAALAALFAAAPAAWTLVAARVRGAATEPRIARFAVLALVPLAVFPFAWNFSYGLRRDWDLCSAAGWPAALLAAIVALREPASRVAAVRVSAICAFTFVPFVLTHAGTQRERRDFALAASFVVQGDGAAAWRDEVSRFDPQRVVARIDEGETLLAAGRVPAALAVLEAAARIEPDDPLVLVALGQAFEDAGRPDDAVRAWESALLTPRENLRFPARLGLARIAIARGDRAAARRHLERAIREDSEHPMAQDAWALLARVR